jgi:hypothetical protein
MNHKSSGKESSGKDKALEMRRAAQILLDRAAELEAIAGSRRTHSEKNGTTWPGAPSYQTWRDRRRRDRRDRRAQS